MRVIYTFLRPLKWKKFFHVGLPLVFVIVLFVLLTMNTQNIARNSVNETYLVGTYYILLKYTSKYIQLIYQFYCIRNFRILNVSLNETDTILKNSIVSLDTKHDLRFQLHGCNCTRTLVREYEYKLSHSPIKNLVSSGKENRFKIIIFHQNDISCYYVMQ